MADNKNTPAEAPVETKTIAVKVSRELHNSVKLAALVAGQSVTDFVSALLGESVKGIKVTNSR